MSGFDKEINDLLVLQGRPFISSSTPSAIDADIQMILDRVRSKAPEPKVCLETKDDDSRINSLLLDIEKEFQDLDDILKEVDEVVNTDRGNV